MIYVIGTDHDQTFLHFVRVSSEFGVMCQPVNVHAFASGDWSLSLNGGEASYLKYGNEVIHLDRCGSYYTRAIDMSSVILDRQQAIRWRALTNALSCWLETIPGIVINRPGHHNHNGAKPLHEASMNKLGLQVPKSLTSSSKMRLSEFAMAQPTIVKTVSGVRADCRLVTEADFEDFDVLSGPVHLQEYKAGVDVRAHVVGNSVIAEQISSGEVDYRKRMGGATCKETELPPALANTLVNATCSMGLVFAGWDLKLDDLGNFWCLEANPMPGYDSYDRRLGGKITEALVRVLGGV